MIKFVLQPILENAISHGVGNLTGGGRIEIVLGCYETGLEFRIRDNGVGMSEEKLQELIESLENNLSFISNIKSHRIYYFTNSKINERKLYSISTEMFVNHIKL